MEKQLRFRASSPSAFSVHNRGYQRFLVSRALHTQPLLPQLSFCRGYLRLLVSHALHAQQLLPQFSFSVVILASSSRASFTRNCCFHGFPFHKRKTVEATVAREERARRGGADNHGCARRIRDEEALNRNLLAESQLSCGGEANCGGDVCARVEVRERCPHRGGCAETKPEPSSRTGRRCSEQRRTWKQEQNSIYFRRKSLSYREDRDTTVTQCNELCIVTPHRS